MVDAYSRARVGVIRAVDRAGRQVDVRRLNRRRRFVDADAVRRQIARIEIDAHRVLRRPADLHLRHAGHRRNALRNGRLGVLVHL